MDRNSLYSKTIASMSLPSPRRERPRTVYASVHRTGTNTPFLYLKPVIYSLTDGTSIPPPPPLLEEEAELADLGLLVKPKTPPAVKSQRRKIHCNKYSPFPSPASYAKQSIFTNTNIPLSPSLTAGPLCSHPITPCTSPSTDTGPSSFFGSSVDSSAPSSSSSLTSPSFAELSNISSPIREEEEYEEVEEVSEESYDEYGNVRRQTWATNRATIGGNRLSTMYEWQAQLGAINEANNEEALADRPNNGRNQQHRSRLLTLLLKPRNANDDHSAEETGLGLGAGPRAYTFEGAARLRDWDDVAVQHARSGLRAKRAVSLGAGLALAAERGELDSGSGEDHKRRTYAANTFPGLVRKKSLNLLNTAKRVSGNWWYGDDEEDMADAESVGIARVDSEGRLDEHRITAIWDPPPVLPDLESLGMEVTGGKLEDIDTLIARIGREEGEMSKRRSMIEVGKRWSKAAAGKRMSMRDAKKRWSMMLA